LRELYLVNGSPYAWRVQLALEHKALDYELRVLPYGPDALHSAEYLALNPRGRVPTLRDGDFVLYESLAILAYLDRRYPDRPLLGTTPEETGTIWRVISEYTAYVDRAVEELILPIYFGRAIERAAEICEAIATLAGELAHFERTLSRSEYLAGDGLTAADFVVFPHLQSIRRASSKEAARAFDFTFLPLATQCPAIAAWISRIEALPGYARTYPPHWGSATAGPE